MEPIRNFFAALFLSSIGMLIHGHFLWNHVDILLASVILVIVVKTAVVAIVTKAFGYSIRTSFIVSWLAQLVELALDLDLKQKLLIYEKMIYLFIGWGLTCSNWRICFCSPKSCLKSSSYWGEFSHSAVVCVGWIFVLPNAWSLLSLWLVSYVCSVF